MQAESTRTPATFDEYFLLLTQRMYQRRQSELDEMTSRASEANEAPAAAVA